MLSLGKQPAEALREYIGGDGIPENPAERGEARSIGKPCTANANERLDHLARLSSLLVFFTTTDETA
jgi:hypothetical protein